MARCSHLSRKKRLLEFPVVARWISLYGQVCRFPNHGQKYEFLLNGTVFFNQISRFVSNGLFFLLDSKDGSFSL